jgi:hypothetical protein
MNDHSSNTLLEEQLAHLEAEKEHIHSVMKEKSREAAELSIRLQETGASLHMRTKQLDELATDIQEKDKIIRIISHTRYLISGYLLVELLWFASIRTI